MIDKIEYPYDDIEKYINWFREHFKREVNENRSWIVRSNKMTNYYNTSDADKVYSYTHFRIFSSNPDKAEVYQWYRLHDFEVDDDGVLNR